MNKLVKQSMLVISLLSAGLIFTSSVIADNSNSNKAARDSDNRQNVMAKLDATKLKSCQAREEGIKQRSSQLIRLVTNMEEKFDKIAQRVKDYYTSKVVPSGKTVSNYAILVSDIQTKKAAVSTALTKAQNDATAFSCTSDDPKAQMTQFRVDMQAVKEALKDYRTSIKNLIVAVHSVTGETNKSSEPSPAGGNK